MQSHANDVVLCPAIYQEVIAPADDLRVTIVDDEVFTARVVKHNPLAIGHIDWRLDPSSECVTDTLPGSVRSKLQIFMKNLGLRYGAIDIRRTHDGDHYFLEINTAGQYLWVEVDTMMPITKSVAAMLVATASQ